MAAAVDSNAANPQGDALAAALLPGLELWASGGVRSGLDSRSHPFDGHQQPVLRALADCLPR
jgi:hypothetical protein